MRRLALISAVPLVAAVVGLACETDPGRRPPWPDNWQPPDGSLILDFGKSKDLSALPDGWRIDKGGPTIQILSPKPKQVVIGATLVVKATITDTDLVDHKTVKVTVQGQTSKAMTATSETDVFEAKIDVTKFGAASRLWIEAADQLGKRSIKVVEFTVDHGPSVTFSAPIANSRWKSSVTIEVVVVDKIPVPKFELLLGSSKVADVKKIADTKNRQSWKGTIFFSKYTPALSGTQLLTARATNQNGATTTTTHTFFVDDKGPVFSALSHAAGTIIGGVITVSATVTDPAGINDSTVKCLIGNNPPKQEVPLTNSPTKPSIYTGLFDTRALNQRFLWPVMSFRAADKLGNESHQDIQVGLDNGPPILSMDPPPMYFALRKASHIECSMLYDFVEDTVDDLDAVPQIAKMRTLITDQGNYVPSAPWIPITEVEPKSVFLYVLDDTNTPLVVDTNGDGYCDDINRDVIPKGSTSKTGDAVAVNMLAVKRTGNPQYPIGSSGSDATTAPDTGSPDAGSSPASPPAPCTKYGVAKARKQLCTGTAAMFVPGYLDNKLDALYGIAPVGSQCVGLPFDFLANKFSEGWVCAATVATDQRQNRGVSRPMRLYYKQGLFLPTKTLPAGAGKPPDCTGTVVNGTVTKTPCKFCDKWICTGSKGNDVFRQLYRRGQVFGL